MKSKNVEIIPLILIILINIIFSFYHMDYKAGKNHSINEYNEDRNILDKNPECSVSVDWYKLWHIQNYDCGYCVDTDSLGNIYIGGDSDLKMGLVKYNSSGDFQWNRNWGGSGGACGRGLTVSPSDNIYIVGFGYIGGAEYADMVLVKYNSSGDLQWNVTWGGTESDIGLGVTVDTNENIIIVGETKSFGGSDTDLVIVKYNSSGSQIWNRTWGGSEDDGGYNVVTDVLNNIYVVGYTTSYNKYGVRDICVIKYNSSGDKEWEAIWGITDMNEGYGIDIDSNFNVYVAGYVSLTSINTDCCLVKFNSTGDYQWHKRWGTSNEDEGRGVIVASDGSIYLTGYIDYGGDPYEDVFLVKLNSSGTELWNKTFNNGGYESGLGIALDKDGNIYTGGCKMKIGGVCWFLLVKFIQIPGSFTLNTDAESPDIDGSFNLTWNGSEGAINYSVYQHNSTITEINNSITLLSEGITGLVYPISGLNNGTYYYKIVAFNEFGNASSNCIQVIVERLPPGLFNLTTDADTPDIDGAFNLNWTVSENAVNYSIYQHNNPITKINGSITLVDSGIVTLSYSFSGLKNGTYYYIIVAFNDNGNKSSNCIQVEVKLYSPGYFILSANAGNPDSDGRFDLTWTSSDYANNYSIYQYNSTITEINGSITLIDEGVTSLIYPISGLENGTHYFIVIAFNNFGNRSSNCISIDVLVAPPGPFKLSSNAENPDTDGSFTLTWNKSLGADNYSVYWSYYPITEFNSSVYLIPGVITELNKSLLGFPNGDFYFIVVAFNINGNRTSNYIQVIVRLAPKPFSLSSNADNPDTDGIFTLNWSISAEAVNYSVYYSNQPIYEINYTVILYKENIKELFCPISGFSNGTYYFVVIAFNDYGNCSSNNIQILVQIPPEDSGEPLGGDDGLPIIIISITIAIAIGATIFIILRKRQKGAM
ncbi:MAG: hypothetical protein ACTSPQ_20605, partial [Candidatus Helarchaeota archaeon]